MCVVDVEPDLGSDSDSEIVESMWTIVVTMALKNSPQLVATSHCQGFKVDNSINKVDIWPGTQHWHCSVMQITIMIAISPSVLRDYP